MRTSLWIAGALSGALLTATGCVSQQEVYRGIRDDLRFTGRIMGFSLDARVDSIRSRMALLRAFKGDKRLPLLEKELGTMAELEQRLAKVNAEKRSLMEEHQRLQRRYQPEEGGSN